MFHLKVVLSLDGVRMRAVLRDGAGFSNVVGLYFKLVTIYPDILVRISNTTHIYKEA